ncbi:type II toxin-antitoxin system VapB family antitoxin [Microlunatus elymi]|uniref:type II toxin-antitoxin system VapB family antitoxin n=1 Tax=Microlunatus elymi TaxID=2596828 RepID=UPI00143D8C5A|nr:type II toxin-antitoxin system VapB family antitoxin [Microlunatus elymi]
MTRTNIDIDDELVETVMKQNHLKTKREAVDFALRRTVRRMPTTEEFLALRGIGFPMSNDEIEGLSEPKDW